MGEEEEGVDKEANLAFFSEGCDKEGFEEDKVKTLLKVPAQVRVVALLAIGRRKGSDKPCGGRFDPSRVVFGNEWGKKIEF